jgi:hypothetical protein
MIDDDGGVVTYGPRPVYQRTWSGPVVASFCRSINIQPAAQGFYPKEKIDQDLFGTRVFRGD